MARIHKRWPTSPLSSSLPLLPTTAARALLLSCTVALLLLPTSCAWEKAIHSHDKTIIAYYASWQWYDRSGLAKPANLDYSKITRINFAFFQPTIHGDIYGTDNWADPNVLFGAYDWNAIPGGANEYCSWDAAGEPPVCAGHQYETGLIYLSHSNGVEVYPSIGGWTLSDNFPTLAANEASRKKFAENCVKLIQDYDFDGIDIDWEYPGYEDHSGTPDDTLNYSLFLKEIRIALDTLGKSTGRFYGLTAALPCGPDLIDKIQVDVVADILTELNLMTYDFHGSFSPKTGVNAPLYDMEGSPDFSVHGCVQNWMKAGGRGDQINIGLPFYGRSFAGSGLTGLGQVHSGAGDMITWSDDEGTPQYFNIVNKISQFTSVRDEQTHTQIAYNSAGLVSYDDERAICDKTEYAMDHNLNGYIIWEISGDILPDLSTPLLDATNDRLNNPNIKCDGSAGGSSGASPSKNDSPPPDYNGKWYPQAGSCLQSDGTIPDWIKEADLFNHEDECCKEHYAFSSSCGSGPVVEITTKPTPNPTNKPFYQPMDGVGDARFYPFYGNDGTSVECRNTVVYPKVPNWISENMLKLSRYDCCSTYFFQEKLQQCEANKYPFYPDFESISCLSDGEHPAYMGGEYLQGNKWQCCDNFFSHDKALLATCKDQ
jgi:chitinase